MPRKIQYKKKYTKKAYRKRANTKAYGRSITNVAFPLGKSQTARLRYVAQIQLNPSAGTGVQDYIFRANDLYDPDLTGIGHQPYGTDQMFQFFDHATVIGSRIKVEINQNSVDKVVLQAGIQVEDESISKSGTSLAVLKEKPMSKFVTVDYEKHRVFGMGFSAKKFFHRKNIVGDALYCCNSASSPTEGGFYHVILAPFNDSQEVQVTTLLVTIEYVAVFTEPRTLVSS